MSRLLRLILLSSLCIGALSAAQPLELPSLKIGKGKTSQDLELRELSVHVELEGHLSETVFELGFFNHTNRQEEGEFTLKLPEGATVSTYALEVNGQMREAVAVDKEQANNAYESIKRQMIDPGFVEREQNNLYRTKIFPILPLKMKRVRIGFIHDLNSDGDYLLKLKQKQSIQDFTCTLTGASEPPTLENSPLKESVKNGKAVWSRRSSDVVLDTELTAQSEAPNEEKPQMVRSVAQADGSRHIIAQALYQRKSLPEDAIKETWSKINLIWDNSYSGRLRDHSAEIAALKVLVNWIGEAEISVQLLSTTLTSPEFFQVESGNLDSLIKFLRQCSYQGATDYSLLEESEVPTLLITDGQLSAPMWAPSLEAYFPNLILFGTGMDPENPALKQAAVSEIDVRTENWIDQIRKPKHPIHVTGLSPEEWNIEEGENHIVLTARLPSGFRRSLSIQPSRGKRIIFEAESLKAQSSAEWNLARRAWAQNRLADLEWLRRDKEAKAHAISERLVSDDTSVIVLERFEDHIRYRIPPPEPHLLKRYQAQLEKSEFLSYRNARKLWAEKVEWYETPRHWLDGDLSENLAAAAIFVKASRKVFRPEHRNEASLKAFNNWMNDASRIVSGKETIASKADFEAWKRDLTEVSRRLGKLREPLSTEDDTMIHVSVRGFVRRKGIYSSHNFLSLKEAIEKAGGPNYYGSYSRVFLYRNGQRTGYNLQSHRTEEILLQNGDMIVVETEPRQSRLSGANDPFSDAFADPFWDQPSANAGGPAVFEEAGTGNTPFVPGIEMPGFPNPAQFAGRSIEFSVGKEPAALPSGTDEALLSQLGKSEDIPSAIRTMHQITDDGVFSSHHSAATIIEIARLLYQREEEELGYKMLTNLAEIGMNPIEATRSIAYWLNDFEKTSVALDLLTTLAASLPDSASRALVQFDIGRLGGEPEPFYKTFLEESSREPTPLLGMALTDYYGLEGQSTKPLFEFKRTSLPSDIRIVATMIGGSVSLEIEIPFENYSPEKHGGRMFFHDRVSEFLMKTAFPGDHNLSLIRWNGETTPTTVFLQCYLNWGRDNQTVLTQTILLEKAETEVDGFWFGWK